MSSTIKILPDHVVDKIAAGEVVERPASVVKELIENSVDSGATGIFIDIEQAGRRLIRITDNGCGMSGEDAQTAFVRHATSKISSETDLEAIRTMGFRGEALSSIAAVSQVRLLTSTSNAVSGVMVEIEGGAVTSVTEAAASEGTSIEVAHLFFNTPARLKFLKSPVTEFSHIAAVVSRQAMANPSIHFKLTHNKKPIFDLPSSMSAKERVFQLYGGDIAKNVIPFSGSRDDIHIHGLIGSPSYSRADRTYQDFFVNRRVVRNPSLSHALYGAYGDMLMRDRHPIGFIFIEIDPALVDVNVHPAKSEVRFRNQTQVHDLVREAIRDGLRAHGMPVLGTTASADEHEAGVRDAVSDYFKSQETERGAPGAGSSMLFGRRKNDWMTDGRRSEPRKDHQGADQPAHPAQVEMSPEHDLFPLAQIHQSFIVAQSREGMVVIDQHAAHERVLFEKLQNQASEGPVHVQNLLVPVQVDLGPAQSTLLSEHLPELQQLGFIVDDFGNGTFVIKAVPVILVGADYKSMLLDILDEVYVHEKSGRLEILRNEILSVMACHPAIKIHRRLGQKEMEILLADLLKCRMPHTCPHGRPTMIRYTMAEINKMFKRT